MSADKQLKAYIDRVLRLKEEQDTLGDDIREVYAEEKVKGNARLANVADVEPSSSAPIAPASHGEAAAHSAERETTGNVAIDNIVPATAPKTARDFRPHCLNPDACGASGLDHCYSCKRAMQNQEEMA